MPPVQPHRAVWVRKTTPLQHAHLSAKQRLNPGLSRGALARLGLLAALLLGFTFNFATLPAPAQTPEILPLSQVHAGMQGYAYTIFSGDQIEKFDLQVIGVMQNFLGPKQSIILVQLQGPKVEHTGVVAGMSGSPVYLDGKLAGALSLKLGTFTKEPIAGVTPIQDILNPPASAANSAAMWQPSPVTSASAHDPSSASGSASPASVGAWQNAWPNASVLQPIESPLVFSGFPPSALQQFASQIQSMGFVAAPGGSSESKPLKPDDAQLKPGGMAGMVLVQGDASISSACTVTAIAANQVYLCGHPFMSLGNLAIPMARTEVVTTLASDLASTKIINVGPPIGEITGDHLTAVTGHLGAPPTLVPLDLTLDTSGGQKKLHFEMINHPRLTPLLVALTTFTGLSQNRLYSEGTTLHLSGEIRLKGHAPVVIENTFAPSDAMLPDALPIALNMQSVFTRLFTNTFEPAVVEGITLKVDSAPGRQSFSIDSAWLEKGEAAPGETIGVRVLLHPYRGPARLERASIRVPDQIVRGTTLRVFVADAELLNRASRGFVGAGVGAPAGLDQLIAVLNRERRNDRLYIGLFVPSPTLVWDDKELPNVPLSEINVVDGRPAPGTVQVLRESLASEASVSLGGPVSGVISLNLQIR